MSTKNSSRITSDGNYPTVFISAEYLFSINYDQSKFKEFLKTRGVPMSDTSPPDFLDSYSYTSKVDPDGGIEMTWEEK